MPEIENNEPLDSSLSRGKRRKFSLMWLIGATTVLAVVFSFAFDSKLPGRPDPTELLWKVLFGASEVSIGIISLAGACFVLWELYANRRWLPHPGYILFLVLACSYLTSELSEKIFFLIVGERGVNQAPSNVAIGFWYSLSMLQFVQVAVCCLGVKRDRFWWRITFVVLAVSILATFSRSIFGMLSATNILSPAASMFGMMQLIAAGSVGCFIVAMVAACMVDLILKRKRDWIHWLGVAGIAWCYFAPTVLTMVASRFITVRQLFGID